MGPHGGDVQNLWPSPGRALTGKPFSNSEFGSENLWPSPRRALTGKPFSEFRLWGKPPLGLTTPLHTPELKELIKQHLGPREQSWESQKAWGRCQHLFWHEMGPHRRSQASFECILHGRPVQTHLEGSQAPRDPQKIKKVLKNPRTN